MSYPNYPKTNDKNGYPVISINTSNLLGRIEPIITPTILKKKYLKGIDTSEYTTADLKREIEHAINEIELLGNFNINHVEREQRLPFDRDLYREFVFVKLDHGPILQINDFTVQSSNGEDIYSIPADWIEMGFSHKRQINIVPLLSVFGASFVDTNSNRTNAGLVFLNLVTGYRWLPAFFTIKYITGICQVEGQVPIIINDIIGMTAAIEILSNRQATFKYNSTSIGQDGISQSASGQGPQTYAKRIEDLTIRRDKMLAKVKSKFNVKYFLSNI